ncbi:hypothetical protein [Promicromonospora sp. NPDC019610]|uniref:hypothetical protein n=1 Tax=Promicromonospora sp. NPDC019610 TaxID=3364405 RepID=UPI00379265F2
MESRPQIVCLCGSARFVQELRAANRDLTLAGAIVLAPAELGHPDDRTTGDRTPNYRTTNDQTTGDQLTDEQKTALGALHLAKIDLADRVVVVNPGGYTGESTRREISYAHRTGKPVEYTHPPDPAVTP